jgi:hypothetical protein
VLRSIGAVVLGYVVMAAFVMLTFSIAYVSMGAERAFQPNSYEPSPLWLLVHFALSFIAAVLGGLVCALVAKNQKAGLWLAGLVIVLGLVSAVPVMLDTSAPKARTGDVSTADAMSVARQPLWVALVVPPVCAVGVLAGSRLRRGHVARDT